MQKLHLLYYYWVFTICGEPVVLKVESLKLMQMRNMLDCYLLDFVVLVSGNITLAVNKLTTCYMLQHVVLLMCVWTYERPVERAVGFSQTAQQGTL